MKINEDVENLEKSCYRKKQYSKAVIKKAKKATQKQFGTRLGFYQCANCNHYHLFTKQKS